jgi:hypothetical protein
LICMDCTAIRISLRVIKPIVLHLEDKAHGGKQWSFSPPTHVRISNFVCLSLPFHTPYNKISKTNFLKVIPGVSPGRGY